MKVSAVEALPDARLRITLANSRKFELSAAEYLDAPDYQALRDPAVFTSVSVEEWGNGVEWPGDIGIPVTALYRLAQEQAGRAFPVEQFNA